MQRSIATRQSRPRSAGRRSAIATVLCAGGVPLLLATWKLDDGTAAGQLSRQGGRWLALAAVLALLAVAVLRRLGAVLVAWRAANQQVVAGPHAAANRQPLGAQQVAARRFTVRWLAAWLRGSAGRSALVITTVLAVAVTMTATGYAAVDAFRRIDGGYAGLAANLGVLGGLAIILGLLLGIGLPQRGRLLARTSSARRGRAGSGRRPAVISGMITALALATLATIVVTTSDSWTVRSSTVSATAVPPVPPSVSKVGWSRSVPGTVRDVVRAGSGAAVLVDDGVLGIEGARGAVHWSYRRLGSSARWLAVSPDGATVAVALNPPGAQPFDRIVILDAMTGQQRAVLADRTVRVRPADAAAVGLVPDSSAPSADGAADAPDGGAPVVDGAASGPDGAVDVLDGAGQRPSSALLTDDVLVAPSTDGATYRGYAVRDGRLVWTWLPPIGCQLDSRHGIVALSHELLAALTCRQPAAEQPQARFVRIDATTGAVRDERHLPIGPEAQRLPTIDVAPDRALALVRVPGAASGQHLQLFEVATGELRPAPAELRVLMPGGLALGGTNPAMLELVDARTGERRFAADPVAECARSGLLLENTALCAKDRAGKDGVAGFVASGRLLLATSPFGAQASVDLPIDLGPRAAQSTTGLPLYAAVNGAVIVYSTAPPADGVTNTIVGLQ